MNLDWYQGRARARFLGITASAVWILWVYLMFYIVFNWTPKMWQAGHYFSVIVLLWMVITCASFLGIKLMRMWTIMVYGPEFYVTQIYPEEVAEYLKNTEYLRDPDHKNSC